MATFPADEKAVTETKKAANGDKKGGQSLAAKPSLEPSKNHQALARADTARGASASPAPDPGPEMEPATRVNAHWNACRGELERHFGNDWRGWLADLIPDADDGETLVLAAPGRFQADWVRRNLIDRLGRVTGRRVEVIVIDYARVRAHEARQIGAE